MLDTWSIRRLGAIAQRKRVMLFANVGTSEDGRLQTCEVGVVILVNVDS